jgi:hypothetical protein
MMKAMQGLLVAGLVLGASQLVVRADTDASGEAKEKVDKAEPKKANPKSKPAAVEAKADELLHRMSADVGALKNFRVDSSQVMEVVTKEGEKIQGLAETTLSVKRPNKMHADRMGPLGGGAMYYDGKTFTFYGKRDNLYATADAPNTIDDTIDFAREVLSIDAPGADLIHSDPYAVLMEDVVSGRYMGEEMVGDRKCHHLAYRGNEVDWQIWIEDGSPALPCRFVITSKKVTGSPQFTVSMKNWKKNESLDDEGFVFNPPEGATKIEFVAISDKVKKTRKTARR